MRARVIVLGIVVLCVGAIGSISAQDQLAQLRQDLKAPNPGLRAQAAMKLGALGRAAKAAVPDLAIAVLDRDLNVRYWAATALRAMGPDAKPAIPALVKALATFAGGSPALEGPPRYYADIRSVAAEALGAIGAEAKEAVPALRQAANDSSPDVKEAAAAALAQIEKR